MTDDKTGSLNPMDVSAIREALARMFPKSLDDIVRQSRSRLSLLGRAAGMRCPWITSEVREIDIDARLVRTRNSLYRLGARGEGEPPQEDLICVCAATHQWGCGALIGMWVWLFRGRCALKRWRRRAISRRHLPQ
jgi:hypothetical protein